MNYPDVRYTITVPLRDNAGIELSRQHDFLRRQLLAAFGGFSMHETEGYWRDGDLTYHDRSIVYVVDTDDSQLAARRINNLAVEVRKDTRQEAIYVTASPIETTLIDRNARADYRAIPA